MAEPNTKQSVLIMIMVAAIVISGTVIISLFARGYRVSIKNGPVLSPTGLISATSKPKSASVYINDRLFTATDDTINLPPGDYDIKIVKDGYLPWEKNVKIKSETVYQTDADLFRSVPDLSPITLSGAVNPVVSPDNSRIIYAVASASATRDNGLYLYETSSPLPLVKTSPKFLSPNLPGLDWSKAVFTFSPNSHQVLAAFKTPEANLLLNLDSPISDRQLNDITAQLPIIKQDWQKQESDLIITRLDLIPKDLKPYVSTDSAKNILFTAGTGYNMLFYLASADGQLKDHIIDPPPPGQSTQKQSRDLKKDNYYVYDIKDDTNFWIAKKDDLQNVTWLPNSNDLVFVADNEIKAEEYDGTNIQKLFGGNFEKSILNPSLDGSQVITLTAAYPGAPLNLYAITIK